MSIETVKNYLSRWNAADKIISFDVSSATVPLAAKALGVEEARIAKTLSFLVGDQCVLIVMAGDAKVDNGKFKGFFHTKAKMLSGDQVEPMTGHPVGGVCPFGVKEGVKIYLDESLRRFDLVYPAAGTPNSAIPLTLEELFTYSNASEWINVSKLPEE